MSEQKIPNTPLYFLWYLGSKYKFLGIASFLLVLVAETLNILIFYVSAKLVDAFTSAQTLVEQKEVLIHWGGVFLLAYIGNSLFYRLSGFTAIGWIIKFHKDGYNELFEYMTKHSHVYFSNRFAGALSNKISNAVDSAAGIMFQILWTFFSEFIGLVVTLVLFFSIDVRVGSILLAMFIVVLAFNIFAVKRRRPLVVTYAEASSKSRGEGVDTITNISAVRQFVQRKSELQRLSDIFTDRARKDVKQSFFGEWIMVVNSILSIIMTAVVIVLLYILLSQGLITAGTLVLVLALLGRVGHMFVTTGQALNRFIRDYGNIEEGLKEILVDHEIADIPDAKNLKVSTATIDWKNVTFEYGDNKVFNEFDLIIPAGQRVGLVGPSGAGKTTFVSLLLRQHDLSSGEILIDGQNIAEVTQDSLRENIAVVPQEPLLFHRTIRENIAYGKPDATDNEIMAVARLAKAHEFIKDLAQGYDTLVGERGIKLSGGQKQRVAIARAMLKDAPILVLDEATSALDSESEVAIQQALHKLMEGKTVIAIAHRLSTLREMDRIIVLEGGKIVEDGSHDSLLQYGGVYSRLWKHQAGGFLQE
ncbi:ABC transporter ATP-binding protein [Candidatus Nomurabacteria bacterium]|nr:ABC transporter ATP-binding protein [Candidatus Nomurabacteria bacterium]MCB9819420.1 ABC transporter ATP-binding protein [Candidatus Nomurabacteria bacterium]